MYKIEQEKVLDYIESNPGTNIWELWKHFDKTIHITYRAVHYSVKKLEEKGLIKSTLTFFKKEKKLRRALFLVED